MTITTTTTIVCLFFSGCPSAIVRRVTSIVVDAIKRVALWAWSHVSQKAPEIVPAITYCDAASTVVVKGGVGRIQAPTAHGQPRLIDTWPGSAIAETCIAVNASSGIDLFGETSTTLAISAPKAWASDETFVSAFTAAQPSDVRMSFREQLARTAREDGPSSDALASQIVLDFALALVLRVHRLKQEFIISRPAKLWRSLSVEPLASYVP